MVGPAIMVMAKTLLVVPFRLSVTVTVKVNGPPAMVGVPNITPPALSVKPGGRKPLVTLHV